MRFAPAFGIVFASGEMPYDFFFQALANLPSSAAWYLPAGIWLLLIVYCIAVGWTQKNEAHGTLARLLWVSVFLASLGALPALIMAWLTLCGPVSAEQYTIVPGCLILNLVYVTFSLWPPVFLRGTKQKLPLVTDQRVLQRIESLARKMNLSAPLVRIWPSITGSQQALAYVGTLQAPQLVVTDGIIHRLDSDEADFVIAHELAHIANGSLFVLAAIIPIGCAVTTAVTDFFPPAISFMFGMAFTVGLRRTISRPIEFDCDYRAARVTGFRVAMSALAKIHAAHFISNSGFLSLIVYATATHPSRDARIAALYSAAPPDDRPEVAPNWALIRRHHWAAAAAATIWFMVIIGALATPIWGRVDARIVMPLSMVAIWPQVLICISMWKRARVNYRRNGQRGRALVLFAVGVGIGLTILPLVIAATDHRDPNAVQKTAEDWRHETVVQVGLAVVTFGITYLWYWLTRKRRALKHKIHVAAQVHDFRQVVDLCATDPKMIRRDKNLRYLQAMADAICGNRCVAIDLLEQLWKDKPRFPLTAFLLGELLLDTGCAERAIEVARSVARQLPRDAAVPILEARALRRLGRIDEAQTACDRALSFEPHSAGAQALASALELDRGLVDQAQVRIARALELAPGDAYVSVVQAEIKLQAVDREQAVLSVSHAVQLIRSNPLVFLDQDILRLEAALGRPSIQPPMMIEPAVE